MQFEGRAGATDGRHHMQAELRQLFIINLFVGTLIIKHNLVRGRKNAFRDLWGRSRFVCSFRFHLYESSTYRTV